jgi:hypothetical protein
VALVVKGAGDLDEVDVVPSEEDHAEEAAQGEDPDPKEVPHQVVLQVVPQLLEVLPPVRVLPAAHVPPVLPVTTLTEPPELSPRIPCS